MDRTAPAFFKQGPSAAVRLMGFAFAALILLAIDARFSVLNLVRAGVSVALYPAQRAMLLPREAMRGVMGRFENVEALRAENEQLRRAQVEAAGLAQMRTQLAAENDRLRALQEARPRVGAQGILTEVLYEARDSYVRRVLIDRGSMHGVTHGQPVVDDKGVIGQVTRAFVANSEVTLLTDINQAIAVQVTRNGIRSIASGAEEPGMLMLQYMPANVDIREGDELVTSGIDGVFPAGLAVARVVKVDRGATAGFARILCVPAGGVQRHKHWLVLKVDMPADMPPPPSFDSENKKAKGRKSRPGVSVPAASAVGGPSTGGVGSASGAQPASSSAAPASQPAAPAASSAVPK